MRYGLISHSHRQLVGRSASACLLYTSHYFKLKRAYCNWFDIRYSILSPRHGIVYPLDRIEPYNWKEYKFHVDDPKWAAGLLNILRANSDVDTFVILGGAHYIEAVELALKGIDGEYKIEAPLKGLRIGEKQQWLRNELFYEKL